MSLSTRGRNYTLDMFKLLAACCVVFSHVTFWGRMGYIVDALGRFCVLLFFMSAGFFSYGGDREKIKKKLLNILRLLIIASLVYIAWGLLSPLLKGESPVFGEYIRSRLNRRELIELVFFNDPLSSTHLWFLLALSYVYAIQYLASLFCVSDRIVFALALPGIAAHILLGEVSCLFGVYRPILLLRNFVFMGFPFFGLGMLLKKHAGFFSRMSWGALIALLLLGAAEELASMIYLGKNEIYLGSVLIAFALVVISIKKPGGSYPALLTRLTASTTNIYIFHILVSELLSLALEALGVRLTLTYMYLRPIIVLILTAALSYLGEETVKKLRRRAAVMN